MRIIGLDYNNKKLPYEINNDVAKKRKKKNKKHRKEIKETETFLEQNIFRSLI